MKCDFRFTPQSGHPADRLGCPKSANSNVFAPLKPRFTRLQYGHQIASTCVARRAFVGEQLNVRTAWFYQRQPHRPAACGTRQHGGLKMGTARWRTCNFHALSPIRRREPKFRAAACEESPIVFLLSPDATRAGDPRPKHQNVRG
jgi:hypothetical protein